MPLAAPIWCCSSRLHTVHRVQSLPAPYEAFTALFVITLVNIINTLLTLADLMLISAWWHGEKYSPLSKCEEGISMTDDETRTVAETVLTDAWGGSVRLGAATKLADRDHVFRFEV